MALACVQGDCLFQAPVNIEPAAAIQAIINHVAADHSVQIPRALEPDLRPPALT